ncbi:hypothetical protein V6N12_042118 [Hibiscus sabdariffa]|uniref:ABC transporter domain-containing protein n=1 Tax=Hibiscus sabdariffa TaxID=183260 RepID=A0ABR2EE79_9ROSI
MLLGSVPSYIGGSPTILVIGVTYTKKMNTISATKTLYLEEAASMVEQALIIWIGALAVTYRNAKGGDVIAAVMGNIFGKMVALVESSGCGKSTIISLVERFYDLIPPKIGQTELQLSGGQKQRNVIARAILKNPLILLLDEATSAFDSNSEKLAQDALEKAMRARTVILTAHRMSTVTNADIIAVVENGKVTKTGTHHSLLYYSKFCKNLFSIQNMGQIHKSRKKRSCKGSIAAAFAGVSKLFVGFFIIIRGLAYYNKDAKQIVGKYSIAFFSNRIACIVHAYPGQHYFYGVVGEMAMGNLRQALYSENKEKKNAYTMELKEAQIQKPNKKRFTETLIVCNGTTILPMLPSCESR